MPLHSSAGRKKGGVRGLPTIGRVGSMSDAKIPNGDQYGNGHCAVCGSKCQPSYLMCGPHWRQVPKLMQLKVYAALDAYMNGDGTLGNLRNAQADAIGVVVS